VSTTTRPSYSQPAVIGGVIMGVLSALPIVYFGNACCCLWVVSGGVIAAYLVQQNQSAPITPADGALVGLLAGLIGACVQFVVKIPIDFLMAPFEQRMLQSLLDSAAMPPEWRDVLERSSGRNAEVSLAFQIVGRVVGLMFWLFVGAIFSTLGGLLGATIFRKDTPPAAIDIPPPAQ
jgi:uncharacterized protein DUF5518